MPTSVIPPDQILAAIHINVTPWGKDLVGTTGISLRDLLGNVSYLKGYASNSYITTIFLRLLVILVRTRCHRPFPASSDGSLSILMSQHMWLHVLSVAKTNFPDSFLWVFCKLWPWILLCTFPHPDLISNSHFC